MLYKGSSHSYFTIQLQKSQTHTISLRLKWSLQAQQAHQCDSKEQDLQAQVTKKLLHRWITSTFLVYGIWYSQRTQVLVTAWSTSFEPLKSWSSEPKHHTVIVSLFHKMGLYYYINHFERVFSSVETDGIFAKHLTMTMDRKNMSHLLRLKEQKNFWIALSGNLV